MNKEHLLDTLNRFLGILYGLLFLILVIFAIVALTGCTQYRYIEVPEYHYLDSIVVRNHTDSVYLHDSVYTSLVSHGDTVFLTKYVTKYKYKEIVRTDTLLSVRVDSVPKIVPVEKEVEVYKMHWWQELFFHIGIFVAFGELCYIVYWLVRKWR